MAQANNKGELSGSFTVPARVRVGTKSVIFRGEHSGEARTTYTGSGTVTTRELRNVVNITTIRIDPLAQTFTLTAPRLLTGVDIWFTQKGTLPVRVQIRETDTGMPNQTILCEEIKPASDLNVDGSVTQFRFDPVSVAAGVEYAIVILTDDAIHKVRIAELGKYDSTKGWVRRQPYQVGVLLSSSNAVTWTAHQNMDLTFKLYAAKFTETTRIVKCGTITVANASDLMPMASVDRTSDLTDVQFVVKKAAEGNEPAKEFKVQDDQVLNLDEKLNGDLEVEAHLTGDETFSPVLMPNPQMALGTIAETATYFTRSISCGDSTTNLKVRLEGQFGGSAGIRVYRETATSDTFEEMTQDSDTESVSDGFVEYSYTHESLDQNNIRIKLELRGTAEDRPRVKNLRVLVTDAA
jgi:hypothetical protein